MSADRWAERLLQAGCGEEKRFKHQRLSNRFPANDNYRADQDGRLGSQGESCSEQRWHRTSEGRMAGLWARASEAQGEHRAWLSAPHCLPVVLHGTGAQEGERPVGVLLSRFRR